MLTPLCTCVVVALYIECPDGWPLIIVRVWFVVVEIGLDCTQRACGVQGPQVRGYRLCSMLVCVSLALAHSKCCGWGLQPRQHNKLPNLVKASEVTAQEDATPASADRAVFGGVTPLCV